MKSTSKGGLKGLEIAEREGNGVHATGQRYAHAKQVGCQHQFALGEFARGKVAPTIARWTGVFSPWVVPWRGLRESVSGC
jgi:hypothetical protein